MKPVRFVAIIAGGVVGAAVRWAIITALPIEEFAWGILVVNTVGSFLLGLVMAMALHPERRDHPMLAATSAGFCGSLTTFSALAVSVADDLRDGQASDAAAMLGVSLVAGLAAAWAGWHLIEAVVHRDEVHA